MSLENLTLDHMKNEWLLSDMTAVGHPARAESDFWALFDISPPIQATSVVGEVRLFWLLGSHLCDLETPS